MRFGVHARTSGGLLGVVDRAEAMGAEAVQVFTQNSRAWQARRLDPVLFAQYRERAAASPVVTATYAHAIYLINLASPDADVKRRSRECLTNNFAVAAGIGAEGVVLHLGSHCGTGLEACVAELLASLRAIIDEFDGGPDLLLENAAGAGGTIGRTVEELALVIQALGGDPRIGVCLDTQHLFASGVSYATPEEMDAFVRRVDETLGLDRVRCLHLNDSKVPFGSNRDRHANIGEGEIGEPALRAFLGHPSLQGLPAILEIPGIEGHGPGGADLAVARRLHEEGLALYR